jgi:hypothetical protein
MRARIAFLPIAVFLIAQQSPISPGKRPLERVPPNLPVPPGLPPPASSPNFTPPPPVQGQFSPPPVPIPGAINGNGITGPGLPPGVAAPPSP